LGPPDCYKQISLTAAEVKGKGNAGVRTGAHALSLLSVPLNVYVLQALAEESQPLADLRRAIGSPPQTTMRGHLRALTEAGIIERRRQIDFPGSVDYQLARPGRELLSVAKLLQDWLAASPQGPLALGSPAAKSSIKALVEGWSAGVVRALAARPFSLTELSSIITGLSYPSLERRLGAMRLAGQIERCPGGGRGTPYKITDWLRHAIAPLAVAARWERQYLPQDTAPIAKIDVESAFLLTVPMLTLDREHSGVCRLAVVSQDGNAGPAGVMVHVENGRIASCVSRLEGHAAAWAVGSAAAWLRAVIDDQPGLEMGGDQSLVINLIDGFRSSYLRLRPRAGGSAE
jgi:DNA-binding HxlR family transcriptional regulator